MRIVIDLQSVQGHARFRGIGRYALSLSLAIAKNALDKHDVIIVLNDCFQDSIDDITQAFMRYIPKQNIYVFSSCQGVSWVAEANQWRRKTAEINREAFLHRLNPDVLLLPSLFEGFVDDVVASINVLGDMNTAVVVYDLIPLIWKQDYLKDKRMSSWYYHKLEQLEKADLLLAISESTYSEAIEYLDANEHNTVCISSAGTDNFYPGTYTPEQINDLKSRFGVERDIVMYTGGIDLRKNVEGLIRAFSLMPQALINQYQLVVVCSVLDFDKQRLLDLARKSGLGDSDVIFTGFVSDEDLLRFYNLATVLVFPSKHEGFGLPILEAMQCGTAVIGSNCTSIPEVIGFDAALFDPYDDQAISDKMQQVLTDNDFLEQLQQHALIQAKKFSWDKTALRALKAIEERFGTATDAHSQVIENTAKPRLAYVSPLPPESSGISFYSQELIDYLDDYYALELVVVSPELVDVTIGQRYKVVDPQIFLDSRLEYDRVVYHFGNSNFHWHMFDLIKKVPGVVVLHDFYLSGPLAHQYWHHADKQWLQALYSSHGYSSLIDFKADAATAWCYPVNLSILQNALGVICHSTYSIMLAQQWYGADAGEKFTVIPHLRRSAEAVDKARAKQALNFTPQSKLVCSFGFVGKTKCNHELLHAWLASEYYHDDDAYLLFVGGDDSESGYDIELREQIKQADCADRIRIIGWLDETAFKNYLEAADVAVQLRRLSRGETSGTVLDVINYKIPLIVNAHGSNAEISSAFVWKLDDEFTVQQLSDVLNNIYADSDAAMAKANAAKAHLETDHGPEICAQRYRNAIENYYATAELPRAIDAIRKIPGAPADAAPWQQLASMLDKNLPQLPRKKALLVDISELVKRDVKTGIQRVVRSILQQLLTLPMCDYDVQPVYIDQAKDEYYYAHHFVSGFLSTPLICDDLPIRYRHGDIFLGLDLQPRLIVSKKTVYQRMRQTGVSVYFVVYDLLASRMPQYFSPNAKPHFDAWLDVVTDFDGIAAISHAVEKDLLDWMHEHDKSSKHFMTGYFHLSADIEDSKPTFGIPDSAEHVIKTCAARPTFLMVGTVEPRKGHEDVLKNFELLWRQNVDVNLVVVGKPGWMTDAFQNQVKNHDEYNARLFWLENISDEYLQKIYASSNALIAASYGEGFGLPIIEAAKYGLPVIARDIEVFREVADEATHFFSDEAGLSLMDVIVSWLSEYPDGDVTRYKPTLPLLSWYQSTLALLAVVGIDIKKLTDKKV